MFSCEYCKIFMNSFFYKTPPVAASEKYEYIYSIHARFTQGLLQLFFTFFDWKTSKWAYHLLQFFISYRERFLKLLKFISQSYLSLLNLFLLLSTFSLFFNDLFFRWIAYKSFVSKFSVLINYILWPYNLFSVSSCFPHFSWSRFFRVKIFMVQVFQGLHRGSGSRF